VVYPRSVPQLRPQVDWLSFNPKTTAPKRAAEHRQRWRVPPHSGAEREQSGERLAAGIDKGYEIQIDDMASTGPRARASLRSVAPERRRLCARPVLDSRSKTCWPVEYFEIEATNTAIKVTLNGQVVTNYAIPANTPRQRRKATSVLQSHTGNVQYQNVMIRSLPD